MDMELEKPFDEQDEERGRVEEPLPTIDPDNAIFHGALRLALNTRMHLFLTGRAGTGKTTFLKVLRHEARQREKRLVVLAPTGVAAMNCGGSTLHSFFQLDPQLIFRPDDVRLRAKQGDSDVPTIYEMLRYRAEKLEIIQNMDMLVIDEVSMVRVDLMDTIDRILRVFRKRWDVPFGGVQLILLGDVFQLPPVVQKETQEHLQLFFRSAFFFSSRIIDKMLAEKRLVCVELQKIYRQNDAKFIELLNRARVGQLKMPQDMMLLNTRMKPQALDLRRVPPDFRDAVFLTSLNRDAEERNQRALAELPGQARSFAASASGKARANDFPGMPVLQLKVGALVMAIVNDPSRQKAYYNGKMGRVVEMKEDGVLVEFGSRKVWVLSNRWEMVDYKWDASRKTIETHVVGTIDQLPLKLAWAMTVHKAQGLTLERVVADLSKSFAPGQVYVCLSRCTSLDGLILVSRIVPRAIAPHPEAVGFARNFLQPEDLWQIDAGKLEVRDADQSMEGLDDESELEGPKRWKGESVFEGGKPKPAPRPKDPSAAIDKLRLLGAPRPAAPPKPQPKALPKPKPKPEAWQKPQKLTPKSPEEYEAIRQRILGRQQQGKGAAPQRPQPPAPQTEPEPKAPPATPPPKPKPEPPLDTEALEMTLEPLAPEARVKFVLGRLVAADNERRRLAAGIRAAEGDSKNKDNTIGQLRESLAKAKARLAPLADAREQADRLAHELGQARQTIAELQAALENAQRRPAEPGVRPSLYPRMTLPLRRPVPPPSLPPAEEPRPAPPPQPSDLPDALLRRLEQLRSKPPEPQD